MHRILAFLFSGIACTHAVTLSLENTPAYAVRNNPDLKAAQLRIDEARARVLGAGRLQNPELDFGFTQNVRHPERTFEAGFTQRFPVTARLRIEKQVTRAQLAAAEAEVRDAQRKIAAEARAAAIKYVALASQWETREAQLANTREQAEFITKRVAAGEASAVDAIQTDLEVEQLRVEIAKLKQEAVAVAGQLRVILGVGADDVKITGKLPAPGPVPAKGTRVVDRPDLEAAGHQVSAARAQLDLARAKKWDDVGAGLTASAERSEDAPDGFSNDYFLGFRVSVPLPIWDKNEGPIAEAQATAERATKERSALATTIRAEVESARSEMAALAALVAEMDANLLPKASALEEQIRNAYTAGQTPVIEVLRARARRLELTQRRIDALRDYHLAKARWDAARGAGHGAKGAPGK
jgi:outer membrane protein, heavy metal efflux system